MATGGATPRSVAIARHVASTWLARVTASVEKIARVEEGFDLLRVGLDPEVAAPDGVVDPAAARDLEGEQEKHQRRGRLHATEDGRAWSRRKGTRFRACFEPRVR
ncbi:MAG: hypothetical protein R3B82_17630 [Sandaracinaceae bacterium]